MVLREEVLEYFTDTSKTLIPLAGLPFIFVAAMLPNFMCVIETEQGTDIKLRHTTSKEKDIRHNVKTQHHAL